jgi:hypothetical protein
LISATTHEFLYQGQYDSWQEQARGTPAPGLAPESMITYLQNHDQVAKSARNSRIHDLTDASTVRALTALLLLGPGTPMLFKGAVIPLALAAVLVERGAAPRWQWHTAVRPQHLLAAGRPIRGRAPAQWPRNVGGALLEALSRSGRSSGSFVGLVPQGLYESHSADRNWLNPRLRRQR